MGCSSYVTAHEHLRASGEPAVVQFYYGLRREIFYRIGDEIDWAGEPPPGVDINRTVTVPGWDQSGEDMSFALTIEANRLASVARVSNEEADRLRASMVIEQSFGWVA
jgi:hypothetical protein